MVTRKALRRPAVATAGRGTAVRPPFWNIRHVAELGAGILAVAVAIAAAVIIVGSSDRTGGAVDQSWVAFAAIRYPDLSPAAAAEAARWTALAGEFPAPADASPTLSSWEALAAIRYPDLSPAAAAEAARWTALAGEFPASPADATPGGGPSVPPPG